MTDDEAIAIADAQLASRGLPQSPVRRGQVFRPARRIVEVIFSRCVQVESKPRRDVVCRVFVDTTVSNRSSCIGALLSDGTPAEYVPWLSAEDPIAAATKYMQTGGRSVAFAAEIVDPTDLFEVYYCPVNDNQMGGDYTVYMLEPGIVIRVVRGQ